MSGLCGWLAEEGYDDPAALLLERMSATLPARLTARSFSTARPTYGLGLRADLREASWHEEAGLCAAIVGYPHWRDASLQAKAEADGHAAALLFAYKRHGRDLLDGLFGHFVFAIVDTDRKRALCAIDRFGVYRLCYATPKPGRFAFATSADAVRLYPGVGATISPQTIYQYLYFIDRVAAPGCIYDEQQKLRAGEAVLFEDGRANRWRYWQLDYRRASPAAKSEQHAALREELEHSVAASLTGEDPEKVGTFLSGGLDSSTVAGFFAKLAPGKGRSVTIGFQHADFDETPYAEVAAKAFGLRHEIFTVGPEEVLAVLPDLACYFDEPYSNSSAIPAYYCAKVSHDLGDDMILAGDGGDELFAGNTRYLKDGIFDHYGRFPASLRRYLMDPAVDRLAGVETPSILRKIRSYVLMARRSVADRMTCFNAFVFSPPESIFTADAMAAIDVDGPRRFAEELYESASGDDKIQKMMNFDLQLTLADSDLRKVMSSCTAAGIRVRFPMLDDDLAAYSAQLPPKLLTEKGKVRHFYKEAMRGVLPQEIIDKPKQGFGLPMFQYIAESPKLAAFFCDALSDLKSRALFAPAFLELLIEEIRQGRPESHAGLVWDLAILETWMASRSNLAVPSHFAATRPLQPAPRDSARFG